MFPLISRDKSSKVIITCPPSFLPFDVEVVSLDPSITTHALIPGIQYKVPFKLPFSPPAADPNENVGILGATGGFSAVVLVVDAGVPNENAGLVVVAVEEEEDADLSVVVVAAAPKLNVGAVVDDDDDVVVAVVIAGVDFSEEAVLVDVNAKGEGPCLGDVDPNENVGLSATAGLSAVDFAVVVVVVAGFSVVAAALLPKLKDGVLIIVLGDVVVLPIENGWAKVVSVAMVLSPVAVIGVAPAPNVNPPATLGDDGGCCADAPNVNVLAVGDVVLLVLDNEEPNAPNAGGVDGVGAAGVKEGEPKGDVVAAAVLVAPAPKGDDVGEPNLKGCCAGDEGAAEVELVAGADVPKLGVEEVVAVVVVGAAAAPKAGVGAAAAVFVPKEKDEGDEGCDPPAPN